MVLTTASRTKLTDLTTVLIYLKGVKFSWKNITGMCPGYMWPVIKRRLKGLLINNENKLIGNLC